VEEIVTKARNDHGVIIQDAYKDFIPPVNARRIVSCLLSGIPGKYISGIKTVVLTNTQGLNRERRKQKTRSRKRKVRIRESCGLYHQQWHNEPAWIEIFVDNLCQYWPSWILRIPLLRDLAFAETVFHEIGHHIKKTQVPEFAEREDVADKWTERLSRQYMRRRYWYLMPLLFGLAFILKPFRSPKKHQS
jgi:hypothetical protein